MSLVVQIAPVESADFTGVFFKELNCVELKKSPERQ